jgi:5'-methylthioadenosine/S-adenosylhomocysteine nucleosidase
MKPEGNVIALLAAMREEVIGVQKRMVVEETLARHGWRLFTGEYGKKEILLVQTGIGREKAEAAAEFVLERYPISTLISFGFAGALSPKLRVGDVVLCLKLHCKSHSDAGSLYGFDHKLLALAIQMVHETAVNLHLGDSVTVDELVTQPEEKQVLGETFSAMAVDMESYWLARAASARQIPFLAVRAISDTLTQSLPQFDRFSNLRGAQLWREAIRHFLARPGELAQVPWVYRNALQARKSLTCFLDAFVPRL